MAIAFIEGLVDEALAYILANQSDKWQEVAARYAAPDSTEIPLDDFGLVSIGDPSRNGAVFDALFVVPDQAAGADDVTALMQPIYSIEFAVLCLGETEDLAKRKCWRRLVGLLEMLREMGPVNNLEWGTGGPTNTYFLPTYTRGGMEFISDARLVVSIFRPETWS